MFQKIKQFFTQTKSASWNENVFFGDGNSTTSNLYRNPKDYLGAYEAISYVGQCASKITTFTSQLQYEISTKNKPATTTEIDNFFAGIVAGERKEIQYRDIFATTMMHILLSGECFWLVDYRSAFSRSRKTPDSVVVIPPSNIDAYDTEGQIVKSNTRQTSGKIEYYRINIGNQFYDVSPENIIKTIMPGPYNMIRGIGIVQQNASYLDQVSSMTIFNQIFFKNGARTNGIVTPKNSDRPFLQDTIDHIKKQIKSEWSGAGNWGKLLFVPSAVEIQKMDLSHNDMQYLEQMRFSREDINAMFSLPAIVAGIMNDVKYDSASEQMEMFYNITCPRFVPFVQDQFQKYIDLIAPGYKFEIKYPVRYDKLQAQFAFDRGILTRNEYRAALGLPQQFGLDDYYMTMQYIPAEDVFLDSTPTEKSNCGCETGVKSEKKNDSARILRRARRTKSRTEKRFAKDVASFYQGQLERILKNLDALKFIGIHEVKSDDISKIFDAEKEKKLAAAQLKSAYQSAVTLGIGDQNELHNLDIDDTTQNEDVVLVVTKLATHYANRTIDTRRDELKKAISDWRESGESWNNLKQNIQTTYEDGLTGENTWKAQRIARTEASYSWDRSAFLAYDELGVKFYDVIGCMDSESDCNRTGVPASERDSLEFHPNHTGIIVPSI